jgi:hypothetical protein
MPSADDSTTFERATIHAHKSCGIQSCWELNALTLAENKPCKAGSNYTGD